MRIAERTRIPLFKVQPRQSRAIHAFIYSIHWMPCWLIRLRCRCRQKSNLKPPGGRSYLNKLSVYYRSQICTKHVCGVFGYRNTQQIMHCSMPLSPMFQPCSKSADSVYLALNANELLLATPPFDLKKHNGALGGDLGDKVDGCYLDWLVANGCTIQKKVVRSQSGQIWSAHFQTGFFINGSGQMEIIFTLKLSKSLNMNIFIGNAAWCMHKQTFSYT